MLAYPPRIMRPTQSVDWRSAQLVKWSPDLYRLRNNRWRLVDGSKPWDSAYTHDYGYLQPPYSTAWSKPSNLGALFEVFDGLPHGIYAVKNYMYWGAIGVTHGHWGGTCSI